MTQVDRITEDIAHMPVAAFIFRDKESDEVHYSSDIRWTSYKNQMSEIESFFKIVRDRMSAAVVHQIFENKSATYLIKCL